jgi:hypothetical protein
MPSSGWERIWSRWFAGGRGVEGMNALVASVAAVALALIPVGAAHANDSTAGLAAGGLVLTKSADIEMRSEDLYISEKLVRVRYSFVNSSPKDLTVTVAFPLPDIDINGYDDNVDVPWRTPPTSSASPRW